MLKDGSTHYGRTHKFSPKVYVVLQRNNLPKEGEPNERVLGVRLTHAAAQALVDLNPGTRIEKHVASK